MVLLASRSDRGIAPTSPSSRLALVTPEWTPNLNRTKPPAPSRHDTGAGTVAMDPTLSSVQIDPHRGVDLRAETKDHFTGVEEALSQLAHRAAREIPDAPTLAVGSDVSVGPPLAELPGPASESALAPRAAEPSARATVADAYAGPQIGEPSV